MSNTILTTQLPFVMKPTPASHAAAHPPMGSPATQRTGGGLFDQFLTQAEKEFLANQLQQIHWSR
ncbi:MAG: hypothetical protein G8237_02905 [Magnetococcales bacterium]|nr:hypothetical protein [Magnetococcales bacterium]NGZ05283.1 hypothetical protein [Magnetococcales bacterium]